jgi:hypothetical protein
MSATAQPVGERRSMPDRVCEVCMQGTYVTREGQDYRRGDAPDSRWHIEACSKCGHVQIFRRDWRAGQ